MFKKEGPMVTTAMERSPKIDPCTKTILIIDDESAITDYFELLLSMDGFNVISVNKSMDALEMLRTHEHQEIDLIILDLMMPELPGYAILQEMHKSELDIPVLVAT